MARFLDDRQVGKAIREIVAGQNVRCAVAFWGDGALNALFGTKRRARKARIICDLTMGGTNPEELVLLGAPHNPDLMHVRGLHAKIYLSDRGLVVASANASNRGIGFVETATLTECGTLHRPGTHPYRDAGKWFKRLWEKKAQRVDQKSLDDARRAWARRPRHGEPGASISRAGSTLLRRIAADPITYRGIGVVFTTGDADQKDVDEASATTIAADDALPQPKLSANDRARLRNWNKAHLFTGWSDAEASAWPRMFLCAHRGVRGAVRYWCYEHFADARLEPDDWSVFASPSKDVRERIGAAAQHRESAKPEDELLARIFYLLDAEAAKDGDAPHRLCESPVHLAQLMRSIGEAL